MNRLFQIKELNLWLLGVCIGLNFVWSMLIIFFGYIIVSQHVGVNVLVQAGMLVAAFLGPFLIGWVVAVIAADLRGPSYGIIGSFGGVVPFVVVLVPTGIFGVMVAITTVMGGLSGGVFSMRKNNKNR